MSDFLQALFSGPFRLPRIGLNSIVDILVIAYVIYKVMLWIKQTRAWSLLKGVVVILVIFGMSVLFDLYALNWLITNTFSVGLMVIVVIFQPELRKALEQLGKGTLVSIFSAVEQENERLNSHTIDEIIAAAKKMSAARTGALMIIEQDVALGDLIATGIPIDAQISGQLIINIFEDKTPLHDGAMIICNNRITAAACILPLTQSEVSSELGTRHRAAIGASEVSDAYCLVVSEETGAISIAKGGMLYRSLSEQKIRSMLTENIKPPRRKLVLWKGRRKNG